VNFPKHSKPGPIPKKPNETGNFEGDHQPKRGSENEAKSEGEKPVKPPPGGEAPSRRSGLNIVQFLNFPVARSSKTVPQFLYNSLNFIYSLNFNKRRL
jgi:hypothetical protein